VRRALELNGVVVAIGDGPHLLGFEDEPGKTLLGQLRGFGFERLDPATPHPAAEATAGDGWAEDPPRVRWHDAVVMNDPEVSGDAWTGKLRLEPGGEMVLLEVRSAGAGVVSVGVRLPGESEAILGVGRRRHRASRSTAVLADALGRASALSAALDKGPAGLTF
jgi:hypothetical protein